MAVEPSKRAGKTSPVPNGGRKSTRRWDTERVTFVRHHFFQVAIAKRVPQIPLYAQNDDLTSSKSGRFLDAMEFRAKQEGNRAGFGAGVELGRSGTV